jgi:hypothetical protein
MRPRVFIGSSTEGLRLALALQTNLENDADITVWDQDVFRPSEYILESLLKRLNSADLGIFVFSSDDLTRMRGSEHASVRDNVVFEFGLFVGRLGRENSIIVSPRNDNPRLPSDLLGINVLKYQSDRDDDNLVAALGPASNSIRTVLRDVRLKGADIPKEFSLPILARRGLLTPQQRNLLRVIELKGPCSIEEIAGEMHHIPAAELNYRLEQLRLLMFITVFEDSQVHATSVYKLSEPYVAVCAAMQPFRSDR